MQWGFDASTSLPFLRTPAKIDAIASNSREQSRRKGNYEQKQCPYANFNSVSNSDNHMTSHVEIVREQASRAHREESRRKYF